MRGIVTVLNTPFTEDDKLDLAGLRKNVALAVEAGVAGFLVPALASEVGMLAESERRELVEAVLAEVDGRVPVVGGASADSQAQRLRLAKTYIDLGCKGILVQFDSEETKTIEADLSALADLGPEFVMVQDWDPAGPGLPTPLIVELFERVPAFKWLKIEVVPAGPKYTAILEATEGRLNVAGGWAITQMIEGLDRGVHAFMPTAMHAIYTEIYRRYASGDREGARSLFDSALPVLAFSNQSLDFSIWFFKRLLHAQGVYSTARTRIKPVGIDRHHERIADELIRRVGGIEASLSSSPSPGADAR